MPKDASIKKVLVIGSGPIVIGQAAEFDYAGTQACRALKEEGIEVVLINSNPATIMTDPEMADHIYIEPLNLESVKKILEIEKPDSILPTLGGQTGLNLAVELAEDGCLDKLGIRLLGTAVETIKMAEDRQEFKDTMERIGEPCIASKVVNTYEEALAFAKKIEFPVIVRPAYTLGGTGGGIAYNEADLEEIAPNGLRLSRVHQVLIEKCISGWKEIEYEVIRESKGNAIAVCNMENVDPVGVHTGDSIVVAPVQTLGAKECTLLRNSALNIITALGIEGGCNVQFALHPDTMEYALIEVNPRLSRSSALASKATGYPIAKVATKIAIGYGLDEIENAVTKKTYACYEPTLDYVVLKFPRWPFDKFVKAKRTLGTQMKATGEVMSIANSFEAALMKAVRSLEMGYTYLSSKPTAQMSDAELKEKLKTIEDDRLFVMAELIRRGAATLEEIHAQTMMDLWFLKKIEKLILLEKELQQEKLTPQLLRRAKQNGFLDSDIAAFSGMSEAGIKQMRRENTIHATYKMVDTCAAEFEAVTPYYYSTYEEECEVTDSDRKKILVLGSGPIRIGQGIEFDYCSVHCVWALKEEGYETIIINNNPETVSTDFDTADRLYFEPLTPEDVENVVRIENPLGAIVQFGGQTAIKLTKALVDMGVKILGTAQEDIDAAEDRERFDEILQQCGIPRPEGDTVFTLEEALAAANKLGYPVLVRPSYVLGGQGMEIAYSDEDITEYMSIINRVKQEHPILIDKYMMGKELEVDAICDGDDLLIPGIMEHLERAGVHSGDSISVYPTQTIPQVHKDTIVRYTEALAKALHVVGLVNIQFVLCNEEVYVIEVNPRSSRTVPYISKVTGIPMVDLATKVVLGEKLKSLGCGTGVHPEGDYVAVKAPVFSFEKLHGVDTSLGPEMKSTGEVLGIAHDFDSALLKALKATGLKLKKDGNVLISVGDRDKQEVIPLAEQLETLGFQLYATANTAHVLNQNCVAANVMPSVGDAEHDVMHAIYGGKLDMIINTISRKKKSARGGAKIRRAAVEHSIPCFTALDTAAAAIRTMKRGGQDETMIDIVQL